MSGEFENFSQVAADALVSAIATDSWEAVKRRFAAVASRDRQIDATRDALAARTGSDLKRAKSVQAGVWATRLHDILDDDPGAAQALLDFLAYLGVTPEPAPRSQSQRADHGSVIVGGDNRGDIATGGSKINKQRYRIFLPFMFFGHAAKQVAAHWVVSTVTVVVVIGGVSGGIALTRKGANTPAPTASTVVPTPPAVSAANWSQLHGDPARTGYQPEETRIGTGNVSKLSLARTYKTNGPLSAPLIANGILYVATNQLYAFNATGAANCSAPATCTPLWTAPTASFDGMTIADGDVFVTDAEGVQAYDAAGSENCSGTPKVCAPLWATSTHTSTGPAFTPGSGSPVVANGMLYVPGYGDGIAPNLGGAYVAAFDAAGKTGCSGTPTVCVPMWTTTGVPASTGNTGSPAIANGVLYIADGSLYAFDATGSTDCSGTPKACAPLWTAAMPSGGPTYAAPAVAGGIVYVSTWYSGLHAFDAAGATNCSTGATPKTCAPLWTAPAPYSSGGTPAVAHGVVYVATNGALAAFDAAAPASCPGTGTVKTCILAPLWTSAASTPINPNSSPTVANGVVYVSSENGGTYGYDAAGSLHCSVSVSAKTCSPLWSAATGFSGGGSPAIVNGVLFINVAGDRTLYAYSL